jgi:phosphatidylglycerol:prolipoprotein diacylglycerol transferase
MYPKLIEIGGFFLPTYGLLVALGFLAGLWLSLKLARMKGINEELIGNLAVYCALAGLAGAKLLMFAVDFGYYRQNPGRLFSLDTLLSAGIYHGGFLAALAFAWFYIRKQKLPWPEAADVLAPGVALGHAIGRLGCFAAGCCWGSSCDRPWAVTFRSPAAHEIVGVPLGVPLHPAQLYEAAATGAIAWILWRVSRREDPAGRVLSLYLILYSIARIVVEFFREHQQGYPFAVPLTWTQWFAVGFLGLGVVLWPRRPQRS